MQLKWGICSAAKISNDFCVALKTLPESDHKIEAVAARSKESAQKFASKFDIQSVYEGYDGLANDNNVDIVYIGAVNSVHFDLCKKFISAGKHVVCEKTMCLNDVQTVEIYDLAKEKKVFIMEALWSRFMPVYKKLHDLIQSGAIGTVRFAQASFGYPIMGIERISNPDLGGGSLLDLGIYPLQAVLAAFNDEEPVNVSASGVLSSSGVDQSAFINLTYSDGRVAIASCCARAQLHNEAQICGDGGIIKILNPFWCPEVLEVTRYQETGKNQKEILPVERYEFPHPASDRFINFENSTGLSFEAEAARQAIMNGKLETDEWSHKKSIQISKILTKARLAIGYKLPCDK